MCAEYTNVQINTPLSMLLLCLQFSMTSLLWHTIIFRCCERPVFSDWIHVLRCFCKTIRSTVYETGGSGAMRGAWTTKLGGRDGSVSVNHPYIFSTETCLRFQQQLAHSSPRFKRQELLVQGVLHDKGGPRLELRDGSLGKSSTQSVCLGGRPTPRVVAVYCSIFSQSSKLWGVLWITTLAGC